MINGFFHRQETQYVINDSVDISTPGSSIKKEKIQIVPGKKRIAVCLPFFGEIVLYEKEIHPLTTRTRKLK